jgi:hypothetical protein
MKLWMLGNRLTTEMYERERFIEEADKYGIDFKLVFADEIDLSFPEMTANLFDIVMILSVSLTVYLLGLVAVLVTLTYLFSDSLKD